MLSNVLPQTLSYLRITSQHELCRATRVSIVTSKRLAPSSTPGASSFHTGGEWCRGLVSLTLTAPRHTSDSDDAHRLSRLASPAQSPLVPNLALRFAVTKQKTHFITFMHLHLLCIVFWRLTTLYALVFAKTTIYKNYWIYYLKSVINYALFLKHHFYIFNSNNSC